MTGMLYLARPLDQVGAAQRAAIHYVQGLVLDAAEALDLAFYQPAYAFALSSMSLPGGPIAEINQAAMDTCAGMVALLPRGVATLGVPAEIENYLGVGKPVLIVVDDYGRSPVQVQQWADREGAMVVGPNEVSDGLRWLRGATGERRGMPARMGPGAVLPNRAYPDDAGFDLVCTEDAEVGPLESHLIATSVGMAIPAGYVGLIVGRSSTWSRLELDVKLGVIDAGWRGDLFVSVFNPLPGRTVAVSKGDRLAQVLVMPVWLGHLTQVEELPAHPRGLKGFGSSGQ